MLVVAPVIEEVLYRGILSRAARDARKSNTWIYAFQFVIFGYIHIPIGTTLHIIFQLIYFVQTGLFAVGFTWLYV
ncbi:MAG: CPBP family glutamic-type intramembrane protease [Candidatus Hodarchaeales archaeon]